MHALNPPPSKEDREQFVKDVASFLKRAEASLSQEEFGNLMKDLSSNMSKLALNTGVLYPTELANLVATFVPVAGKYVPHNSKVVTVDLVQRMEKSERHSNGRNVAMVATVTTFLGMVLYWPSMADKLEAEDKRQSNLIAALDKKLGGLEARVSPLEIGLIRVEGKVDLQDKAISAVDTKITPLEKELILMEHNAEV